MKQEEAIAQQQKENELIATAAHKAAAAEALAAGHPGIKVSMSQPGVNDGSGGIKRQRVNKLQGNGVARKKNTKAKLEEMAREAAALAAQSTVDGLINSHNQSHSVNIMGNDNLGLNGHVHSLGQTNNHDPSPFYSHTQNHEYTNSTAGPSHLQHHLTHPHSHELDGLSDPQVDLQMVQQAMQAAAGQMDELEMGMQIPIEMQLHGSEHDDGTFHFGVVGDVGDGVGVQHPYTPHSQGFDGSQYGYTGQGGVYGFGHGQG